MNKRIKSKNRIFSTILTDKAQYHQVRDIDGIPLLLDCTPIDANNPIMTQWVIFALRYKV